MILPSKHLPPERALLTVGATLLARLERPMTVSALWHKVREAAPASLSFDWFVLALDLLYILDAVQLSDGILVRNVDAMEPAA